VGSLVITGRETKLLAATPFIGHNPGMHRAVAVPRREGARGMIDRERQVIDQIPHLRRYAAALLGDRDAADDLVQDCLTRAVDRLDSWRPDSSMWAWLFTILHNLYVNQRRDQSRQGALYAPTGDIDRQAVPPSQDSSLALRDISAALAQLSHEQRSVILLVGLEGLSYADAAMVTGAPLGTVMSRLARGRERLRRMMDGGPNGGKAE
jgi:RNA polymerase sigma-70 factor (ECF subfamily)